MNTCICDTEPSTSFLQHNVYHLHVPLAVLDFIRLFQDHPKYKRGIQEQDITEMIKKDPYACGDTDAQVKMALKELQISGFVRLCQQGYRTLGPFSKLGLAKTPRQFNSAWDQICEDLGSCTNFMASG